MVKKNNIINLLIVYFISHFLLWVLIPTFTNTNLPLDTIEALAWGSNLDWGFDKHPPMSAAMVELVYFIFGNNDWAYYMLSQIFVLSSIFVVWTFAKEFLKSEIYAFISVLMLSGIYFFNFTTPEFNVNVCQLPFWALTVLYSWKSLNEKKITNWFFLGIFAAFGFLSKYIFIFLLLSLVMFYLFNLKHLKKVDNGVFVSLFVFFIIIFPHIFWLVENNFLTIQYGLSRSSAGQEVLINHLINPIIFISKQFLILTPIFILCFCLIKKIKFKINPKDKKFLFLAAINLIPLILLLIISIIFGAKIRTMWMTPFYLYLPLFLIYIYQKNIDLKKINRFIFIFIFLFLLSPIFYLSISIFDETKRTDYPGREIADLVQRKWDNNFRNEINVVVGDEWAAGNLSYHLVSRPKWFKTLEGTKNFQDLGGVIYAGNPSILKKICPGEYGTIKPTGYCMIGKR